MERYPWMCTHVLICYLLSACFLLLVWLRLLWFCSWLRHGIIFVTCTGVQPLWILSIKLYSLTRVAGTKNENYSFWMKPVKFKYSLTFSCFVIMCVVVLSAISRSVLWNWEANHPSLSSQTVTWTELWDRSECKIWASVYLNCRSKIKDTWSLQFCTQQVGSFESKAWKNSGLNGIWTHDLWDTDAVHYQLS